MHQCTHCQAELAANAQFCVRCGTPTEESQTRSADIDEAHTNEAESDTTSKLQAVAAPATPALPTLRTRRMHPQSSISAFPQDPWLPGSEEEEDNTTITNTSREEQDQASPAIQLPLTPPAEAIQDSPQIQEEFTEPASSEQITLVQPEKSDEPVSSEHATLVQPDELNEPMSSEHATLVQPENSDELASSEQTIAVQPEEPAESVSSEQTTLVQPENSDELASSEQTVIVQPDEPPQLAIDELDTISLPTATPEASGIEASSIAASGEQLRPVQSLVDTPEFAPAEEISAAPTSVLTDAPSFSPPAPAKQSTPRPATPLPPLPSRKGGRAGKTRMLVVALIVVLVVLAAGAGAFALVRQHTSPGASALCNAQQTNCLNGTPVSVRGKPTSLAFSGKVAGPMSIVAKPNCQSATSGNLRTLTVNLSGTINDQLYNFGFAIARYNGPGTYSNATASITILFDVPGESTANGWGNSATANAGSITVAPGEQTGSISYTLSGVGSQAGTQVQATGNWTCNN